MWLTGLQPNTPYLFRVYSRDEAGNMARSPESRFMTASEGGMTTSNWLQMLGWCGWVGLFLLALLAIATGIAVYWYNEARRLKKKLQKKT